MPISLRHPRALIVIASTAVSLLLVAPASAQVSSATFTTTEVTPDPASVGTITLVPIGEGPFGFGKFVFGGDVNVSGAGSGTAGSGAVLGASTGPNATGEFSGSGDDALPAGCTAYLDTYLKRGVSTGESIRKLQQYLNDELGLDLPTNGLFGDLTFGAVKLFQLKHNDDILKPWVPYGLPENTPTGYVYKTTLHYINMSKCKSLNEPMPQLP